MTFDTTMSVDARPYNEARGRAMGAVIYVFIAVTTITVALRIYVRAFMTRNLALDDFCLILSQLITAVGGSICAYLDARIGDYPPASQALWDAYGNVSLLNPQRIKDFADQQSSDFRLLVLLLGSNLHHAEILHCSLVPEIDSSQVPTLPNLHSRRFVHWLLHHILPGPYFPMWRTSSFLHLLQSIRLRYQLGCSVPFVLYCRRLQRRLRLGLCTGRDISGCCDKEDEDWCTSFRMFCRFAGHCR